MILVVAMDSSSRQAIQCQYLREPSENQLRQIADLYRAQGWWQSDDDAKSDHLARLISGSHCFVVATEGHEVIAMGRAISDGISDAYIQDLTVRKDRRRRGIAGRIINLLIEQLHRDGIFWIGLIAEPGSANLYRRFAFQEMPGAIPMLMKKEP